VSLYNMAARITELVWRRNIALTWLHRATPSAPVIEAIHVLEDEPLAGQLGGPARAPEETEVPHPNMSLHVDGYRPQPVKRKGRP
jgi:hypothetical protein